MISIKHISSSRLSYNKISDTKYVWKREREKESLSEPILTSLNWFVSEANTCARVENVFYFVLMKFKRAFDMRREKKKAHIVIVSSILRCCQIGNLFTKSRSSVTIERDYNLTRANICYGFHAEINKWAQGKKQTFSP